MKGRVRGPTSREGRSAEVVAALSSLALRQETRSGGDVGTLEPWGEGWVGAGMPQGSHCGRSAVHARGSSSRLEVGGRLSHLLTALGLHSCPFHQVIRKRVLPHQTSVLPPSGRWDLQQAR